VVFEQKEPFRDSYFLMDDGKIQGRGLHEEIKKQLLEKRVYSTYEVDDLVLGPLEDLGSLEREEKVISFNAIYTDSAGTFVVSGKTNTLADTLKARGSSERVPLTFTRICSV
jgi:hypothetical protein